MATWSDEYREVVTYYFWEPNHLRPKTGGWPSGPTPKALQMWNHVSQIEVASNHVLNFYFSLVPFSDLNRIAEWVSADEYEMLPSTELRAASDSFGSFTQPDMYFRGPHSDLALELKVTDRTRVEQVSKYIGFQGLQSPGRPWTLLYVSPYESESQLVEDAPSLEAAVAAASVPASRRRRVMEGLAASWEGARSAMTARSITFDELSAVIQELHDREWSPIARRVHAGMLGWLREPSRQLTTSLGALARPEGAV